MAGGGRVDHVSQRLKKQFYNSCVLKQLHVLSTLQLVHRSMSRSLR